MFEWLVVSFTTADRLQGSIYFFGKTYICTSGRFIMPMHGINWLWFTFFHHVIALLHVFHNWLWFAFFHNVIALLRCSIFWCWWVGNPTDHRSIEGWASTPFWEIVVSIRRCEDYLMEVLFYDWNFYWWPPILLYIFVCSRILDSYQDSCNPRTFFHSFFLCVCVGGGGGEVEGAGADKRKNHHYWKAS